MHLTPGEHFMQKIEYLFLLPTATHMSNMVMAIALLIIFLLREVPKQELRKICYIQETDSVVLHLDIVKKAQHKTHAHHNQVSQTFDSKFHHQRPIFKMVTEHTNNCSGKLAVLQFAVRKFGLKLSFNYIKLEIIFFRSRKPLFLRDQVLITNQVDIFFTFSSQGPSIHDIRFFTPFLTYLPISVFYPNLKPFLPVLHR